MHLQVEVIKLPRVGFRIARLIFVYEQIILLKIPTIRLTPKYLTALLQALWELPIGPGNESLSAEICLKIMLQLQQKLLLLK